MPGAKIVFQYLMDSVYNRLSLRLKPALYYIYKKKCPADRRDILTGI
jgi:hypothetical protein